MISYQTDYPAASPFFEASKPLPSLIAESEADEFRLAPGLACPPPLECGLTVVCRAAADAETGGPAGRPAFAAPKRRPPREGAIDTRRVLIRAIRDRVKPPGLTRGAAALSRLAFRNARRIGRRAPRRALRCSAARLSAKRSAGGDSGDGPGEATPGLFDPGAAYSGGLA